MRLLDFMVAIFIATVITIDEAVRLAVHVFWFPVGTLRIYRQLRRITQ